MNDQDALKFVDQLVYHHTGKYLSDLERDVFVGSWQGKTYEEIYPINPEYVEKYVGYRLWQKLSAVCGEKVTKKQIRGALERIQQRYIAQTTLPATPEKQRVFISCRDREPDLSLAKQFYTAILQAGHDCFMTACDANSPLNHDRLSQIEKHLYQCDYFLLLLSPHATVSEMVLEELRQATALSDRPFQWSEAGQRQNKLRVLPIRINYPRTTALPHDLQPFLQDIPQQEWNDPRDTTVLIQAVLHCLSERSQGLQASLSPTSLQSTEPTISPLLTQIPPAPNADPELPQGQVRLDSSLYVERIPYEAQCYREIGQPGTLIRIKAPRQMGKTSLMSRILYQAREQGYHTVPLSFQHADVTTFTSLNHLLQWFCSKVARKLRVADSVHEYWTDTYGSKDNCTMYFEDCLLSKIDVPLVLGLDEVDRIFQHPNIADDFFGLLRAWYEEAGYGGSDSGLWEKLRLVVVHSTEVYIPLDVNQSPFNVGLPIELSEFTFDQVFDLVQRHRLNWDVPQVEQLMAIVGGHPYLIRLALYHLAQNHLTLSDLIQTASTEAGIYGEHLRRHLWNLRQHPDLGTAFSQVVNNSEAIELESILAFKLHSLGLVHLQGNEVTPRFTLYRQYFRDRL